MLNLITFIDITYPNSFRMNTFLKKYSHCFISCYLSRRQQKEEEATLVGHVQVTLADDNAKPHETKNGDRSKVRNDELSRCHSESLSSEILSGPNSSCGISSCSAETSPPVGGHVLSLCLDNL